MVGFGSDLNKPSEGEAELEKWSSVEDIEKHFGELDDEAIRQIVAERKNMVSVPLDEIAKMFGIDLNALSYGDESVNSSRRPAGFSLPDGEREET